jgi:hypothetical protein
MYSQYFCKGRYGDGDGREKMMRQGWEEGNRHPYQVRTTAGQPMAQRCLVRATCYRLWATGYGAFCTTGTTNPNTTSPLAIAVRCQSRWSHFQPV